MLVPLCSEPARVLVVDEEYCVTKEFWLRFLV